MEYKNIKDFLQRCEEHPDHQMGMISSQMVQDRLSEEIDELRMYIEQRTWAGLTHEECFDIIHTWNRLHKNDWDAAAQMILMVEAKLKEKNT